MYSKWYTCSILAHSGIQWNSGYAKRKLKCHGDLYTLSQCFVWITILLFNQLAEFWVAYFRVVYFPAIVCADPNLKILSLKIGRNNN